MSKKEYSVLRVVWDFAPKTGGSITHIKELSLKINPFLEKQVIVAPYCDNCQIFDKSFPIQVIRMKVPLVDKINFPLLAYALYSLSIRNRLINIIEENDINIIHFHDELLASLLNPFLRKYFPYLKIVVMSHGWYDKKTRGLAISYRVARRVIPLNAPDWSIILNDGTQIEDLKSIINKKVPIDIVYHAIDTDYFKPSNEYTCSDSFVVLFPHRPILVKRPDLAIKIFKQFMDMINDKSVQLVFLGAKNLNDLKTLAHDEGIECNVQFLDFLSGDALVDFINTSSVVIGTSLNSNNGRAIQESMSCQKPVVAFNIDSNMSNLIKNMENGILIESASIAEFANSLVLLYNDPLLRQKIGINARDTIIKHRSWEDRVKKELSVYDNLF